MATGLCGVPRIPSVGRLSAVAVIRHLVLERAAMGRVYSCPVWCGLPSADSGGLIPLGHPLLDLPGLHQGGCGSRTANRADPQGPTATSAGLLFLIHRPDLSSASHVLKPAD